MADELASGCMAQFRRGDVSLFIDQDGACDPVDKRTSPLLVLNGHARVVMSRRWIVALRSLVRLALPRKSS